MPRQDNRAASPGGPPEADADDDVVDDAVDSEEVETEPPAKAPKQQRAGPHAPKREFLLFYQKKYFKVPAEAIVFDRNSPFVVESGLQANEIHDCKSFTKWVDVWEVHTRHMVKVKFEDETGVHTGLYVTFKIEDEESDDPIVIRALHKGIQQQYYESWLKTQEEGGWTESKREKYAELVADKPSGDSQINPLLARWKSVPPPNRVLYERPKKEKKGDAAPTGVAGIKKPLQKLKVAAAAAVADDDDDGQSSAAQSTALTLHHQHSQPGASPIGPGGGGFSFYANTPGMVTIDKDLYEKMASAYYSCQ